MSDAVRNGAYVLERETRNRATLRAFEAHPDDRRLKAAYWKFARGQLSKIAELYGRPETEGWTPAHGALRLRAGSQRQAYEIYAAYHKAAPEGFEWTAIGGVHPMPERDMRKERQ